MSSISPNTPKRGEIWLVDFNPTRGAEIQKQRPALVVNSDAIGRLPIKLVAPITGWKPAFAGNLWHVMGIIGPRGGNTGAERTVVKDEPLPPTPKPGQTYRIVDRTKTG